MKTIDWQLGGDGVAMCTTYDEDAGIVDYDVTYLDWDSPLEGGYDY